MVYHGRTKHIDIKAHFIRNLVAEGKLGLRHCNTKGKVVEFLTKPLKRHKHEYLNLCLVYVNLYEGQLLNMIQNIEEFKAFKTGSIYHRSFCLCFYVIFLHIVHIS